MFLQGNLLLCSENDNFMTYMQPLKYLKKYLKEKYLKKKKSVYNMYINLSPCDFLINQILFPMVCKVLSIFIVSYYNTPPV